MAIAATLSALLFAAGCGGSDDSATGSSGGSSEGNTEVVTVETGSLSKAAFIKQADPICKKAFKQFETKLFKSFEEATTNPPKPTEPSHQEIFFETEFPEVFQQQIDEISALGAPPGDEEEITALLEALQKMVNESNEDPIAFSETFVEGAATFGKAAKLAKAYGLTGCLEES